MITNVSESKTIFLAKMISLILGYAWVPCLLMVTFLNSGLNHSQLIVLVPVIIIIESVIPFFSLLFLIKYKIINDWDLSNRKERYTFLAYFILLSSSSLYLLYQFGTILSFKFILLFLILAIILYIITLFWKISLHTAANTLGTLFINYIYGFSMPWLFLIIPLIIWSRYTLKKHTVSQLIAGFLVSFIYITFGMHYIYS
jgi:hypothetical protein